MIGSKETGENENSKQRKHDIDKNEQLINDNGITFLNDVEYDRGKSVNSISRLHKQQKINTIINLQQTHGNRYVQRMAEGSQSTILEEDIKEKIEAQQGSGSPLESVVRSQMEEALDYDFNNVHVHTDSEADKLSRSLGAKAFTIGNDLFFKEGAYNPETDSGKSLLGHELSHTIQQSKDLSIPNTMEVLTNSSLENEADQAGEAAAQSADYAVTGTAPQSLQRGDDDEGNWLSRATTWVAEQIPGTEAAQDRLARELEGAINIIGKPMVDAGLAAIRDDTAIRVQLGEARRALGQISWTAEWIKGAWNLAERANAIADVITAFNEWGRCDPMVDRDAYIRAAGRSLAALGELGGALVPAELGPVGQYFEILQRAGEALPSLARLFGPSVEQGSAGRALREAEREAR